MDIDGDGREDLISGSWPGALHWFRRNEDGTFAAAATIVGKDGKPVDCGRASAPFASDWDADGDLDLLVGNIDGHVFWVVNESGGSELALGSPVALQVPAAQIGRLRVGRRDLEVSHGDSAPVVADWDRDGRHDLVVGAGDGSVTWYRNVAGEGAPVLEEARTLLDAQSDDEAKESDPPRRGGRVKICVADWNADGVLDLVIGDFVYAVGEAPVLTEEQQQESARLEEEMEAVQKDYAAAFERLHEQIAAEGIEDEDAVERRIAELMESDEGLRTLSERMRAIWEAKQAHEPPGFDHGRVWVFLRHGLQEPPDASMSAPR